MLEQEVTGAPKIVCSCHYHILASTPR
jgi:hypothetical protein